MQIMQNTIKRNFPQALNDCSLMFIAFQSQFSYGLKRKLPGLDEEKTYIPTNINRVVDHKFNTIIFYSEKSASAHTSVNKWQIILSNSTYLYDFRCFHSFSIVTQPICP